MVEGAGGVGLSNFVLWSYDGTGLNGLPYLGYLASGPGVSERLQNWWCPTKTEIKIKWLTIASEIAEHSNNRVAISSLLELDL